MAIKCNNIFYPTKCYECHYSLREPDEQLRTGSACNISIKELCPRTAEGAGYHQRLIKKGKRHSACMINRHVKKILEV